MAKDKNAQPPSFRELSAAVRGKKVLDLHRHRAKRAEGKSFEEQAAEIARFEAGVVGSRCYLSRLLVQVNLPHSKLKETYFERRNGSTVIWMMARPSVGLPYGTYPRLIMAWVTSEALKTKSPTLELGNSLRGFMRQLGLDDATGGERGRINRLRNHFDRLFCSTISWNHRTIGHELGLHFAPFEERHLWWDPKHPDQASIFKSTLTLNQRFYEEIVTAPVPVDMRALKLLAQERSPLAIDIYTWLTYRLWRLDEPVCIPWEALQAQFGSSYRRVRDFKAAFVEQLRRVKCLYPGARAFPDKWADEPGLVLEPSPPHVAPRLR